MLALGSSVLELARHPSAAASLGTPAWPQAPLVGDQRAIGARRNRAVPRLPAREDVIHDPGALRVGHELRTESDQASRRDPKLQPHTSAAVVHQLRHHAFSLAYLRDDDALMILR